MDVEEAAVASPREEAARRRSAEKAVERLEARVRALDASAWEMSRTLRAVTQENRQLKRQTTHLSDRSRDLLSALAAAHARDGALVREAAAHGYIPSFFSPDPLAPAPLGLLPTVHQITSTYQHLGSSTAAGSGAGSTELTLYRGGGGSNSGGGNIALELSLPHTVEEASVLRVIALFETAAARVAAKAEAAAARGEVGSGAAGGTGGSASTTSTVDAGRPAEPDAASPRPDGGSRSGASAAAAAKLAAHRDGAAAAVPLLALRSAASSTTHPRAATASAAAAAAAAARGGGRGAAPLKLHRMPPPLAVTLGSEEFVALSRDVCGFPAYFSSLLFTRVLLGGAPLSTVLHSRREIDSIITGTPRRTPPPARPGVPVSAFGEPLVMLTPEGMLIVHREARVTAAQVLTFWTRAMGRAGRRR